jgi:hypothetical protein
MEARLDAIFLLRKPSKWKAFYQRQRAHLPEVRQPSIRSTSTSPTLTGPSILFLLTLERARAVGRHPPQIGIGIIR